MRFLRLAVCFLFLSPEMTSAQGADTTIATGKLTINNIQFDYIKLKKAGDPIQQIFELYKHDQKLLTHTLMYEEGDCNSLSLELGDVASTDSTITFYSYWAWVGGCCGLPYGARKQVYTINKEGQLHLSSSEIFLEKYKTKLSKMSGEEATKFKAGVEKEYHAKFVTANRTAGLISEVKLRFAKQILKETAGWEKNSYGYRR